MTEPHPVPGEAEPQREALPPSMRDRIPFLLYRAAEQSHSLANDMLARTGLTARQVGILTLVIEREPMTQKALGDLLRIEQQRHFLAPLTAAEQQQLGALLKRLQRPPRRPGTPG